MHPLQAAAVPLSRTNVPLSPGRSSILELSTLHFPICTAELSALECCALVRNRVKHIARRGRGKNNATALGVTRIMFTPTQTACFLDLVPTFSLLLGSTNYKCLNYSYIHCLQVSWVINLEQVREWQNFEQNTRNVLREDLRVRIS